ncbi:MAG: hypothetical protein NTV46_16545, partial [Verrucomicrobia bacterium]|nr:hypothetical protein [Verrucomicrobiota bacterium]
FCGKKNTVAETKDSSVTAALAGARSGRIPHILSASRKIKFGKIPVVSRHAPLACLGANHLPAAPQIC